MTTDELRAVAERFVTAYDGMEAICGPVAGSVFGGPLDDAVGVCRAYLAEHPADDAEPVTEEWLREVGFKLPRDNPHCPFVFSEWGSDRYCVAFDTGKQCFSLEVHTPSDGMSSYQLPDQHTRGAVRRLLVALGIMVRGA